MVKSILESLRHELLTRCPLDALPEAVWKRTGALNTWGTNAIEGNTLTRSEVEKLLLEQRSVSGRPMSDIMETIQHEAAFRGLLGRRAAPVTMLAALEMHEAVFRGIKADAGQWRRVNVRIVGSRHTPPRMEKVIPMMEEWEKEYASREMAGELAFALGAWMHRQFEAVHPFSDGNGRVGRLLLNLHFLKHNWPPVHILPPDRERYLHSLERGHLGEEVHLVELLELLMGRSMVDLLDQVGTKDDELKPLKKLEKSGPYSAKYLALRAGQGRLPAVKVSGDWRTSQRVLTLYVQLIGRE